MSSGKKHTKVDLLKKIPEGIVALFFKVSIVLLILNLFSVCLGIYAKTDITIALLSTAISVFLSGFCYVILLKKRRNNR